MNGTGELIFVTGGARSGKSAFAEWMAESWEGKLLYIATAQVRDGEMAERVRLHRERRGERWELLEEPLYMGYALEEAESYGGALLDCLTLWTSNLMERYRDDDTLIEARIEELVEGLKRYAGNIVVVTNETGLGIVPADPLSRRFRDLAGLINQKTSVLADRAYLIVAGRPLELGPPQK